MRRHNYGDLRSSSPIIRRMSSLRKYAREAWLSRKVTEMEKVEFFDGQMLEMEKNKLVFFDRKSPS